MTDHVAEPVCDVVLPCLDEAAALPWVLARMPVGYRPIVVDNGSRDGSADIAAQWGATVVLAEPRGYGAACHTGLLVATSRWVAVMDADASLDPQELPKLVQLLRTNEADLVVGARRLVSRASQSGWLRLANAEMSRRLRRRTGLAIRDLGPMRVAGRIPLVRLDLQDRRSGYPVETVVRAADAGWRIRTVDVDYFPRKGRSKVTGTPLGAWRAVRDMNAMMAR